MGFMMDALYEVTNASTGNQTFTGNLGGQTATGAIFINNSTTDATVDHVRIVEGMTDGTNEQMFGGSSQDAQLTSVTDTDRDVNNCIGVISSTGNYDAIGSFVSFGVDSVTINWSTMGRTGTFMLVILIAGVDCHVGSLTTNNTNAGTATVTGLGSQPNFIFSVQSNNVGGGNSTNMILSNGFCSQASGGAITQGSQSWYYVNGLTTSETYGRARDDRLASEMQNDGTNRQAFEVTSFTSDGFVVTSQGTTTGTHSIKFLALTLPDDSSAVINNESPTSTGTQAFTGTGFLPDAIMSVLSNTKLYNTNETDGTGAAFGISFCNGAIERVLSHYDQTAVGTTNSASHENNDCHNIRDDDGTLLIDADFSSFDADGVTLNYNTVDAVDPRKFTMVAFKYDRGVRNLALTGVGI